MRFDVAAELRQFADSVRGAVGGWEAAREPELGEWLDDRDDVLTRRLGEVGWKELWDGDPAPVVAGGLELGRACAPLCLVDEVALGAPLALHGRIRHGEAAGRAAVPLERWGLAFAAVEGSVTREPTLDGSGTIRAQLATPDPLPPEEAAGRWDAWTAATLGYLAGLARAALDASLVHARTREQFGAPLASLPVVQGRLADAALAATSLELTAWASASPATATGQIADRPAALLWAGSSCREVTASAQQIHGALGFALETGLHRYYRRAKSAHVWTAAVCRACAAAG